MSRWQYFNTNPRGRDTIDCAVRAVAAALGIDWRGAYALIHAQGYGDADMGPANGTWGAVLRRHGFRRAIIPNTCPDCYTAEDFCRDNPRGVFVLGFEGHTAAVIDGRVWDAIDSTWMCPQYIARMQQQQPQQPQQGAPQMTPYIDARMRQVDSIAEAEAYQMAPGDSQMFYTADSGSGHRRESRGAQSRRLDHHAAGC